MGTAEIVAVKSDFETTTLMLVCPLLQPVKRRAYLDAIQAAKLKLSMTFLLIFHAESLSTPIPNEIKVRGKTSLGKKIFIETFTYGYFSVVLLFS